METVFRQRTREVAFSSIWSPLARSLLRNAFYGNHVLVWPLLAAISLQWLLSKQQRAVLHEAAELHAASEAMFAIRATPAVTLIKKGLLWGYRDARRPPWNAFTCYPGARFQARRPSARDTREPRPHSTAHHNGDH